MIDTCRSECFAKLLGVILPYVLLCIASATAPPKQCIIKRCATPPKIDGELDDDAWRDATKVTGFKLLGSVKLASQQTEVLACYDERALYIAAICHEAKMSAVRANVKERDANVYEDDCFEVFLTPLRDASTYYHFIVSVANVQRDDIGMASHWDAKWQSAVKRYRDRWTVEIAIPFAELDIPVGVTEHWRINFAREERPHGELSCWSPCESGFHEPKHFGWAQFVGADFTLHVRHTLLRRLDELHPRVERLSALEEERIKHTRLRTMLSRVRRRIESAFASASRILNSPAVKMNHLADAERLLNLLRDDLRECDAIALKAQMISAGGESFRNAVFVICRESTMTKVRRDKPYRGKPIKSIRVHMARNEYEAVQLIVVPIDRDLKNVRVHVGAFRTRTGVRLPKDAISVRVVGYVHITRPSVGATAGTGWFPDPLLPLDGRGVDIPRNTVQPFWVTFHTTPAIMPGDYEGAITFAPQNASSQTIRVRLTVWRFALPLRSYLRTAFRIIPNYIALRHDLPRAKHIPLQWNYSVWSGADIRGIPNYFGIGVFEPAIDRRIVHTGRCAVRITALKVERGSHESPRACYYTDPIKLEPNTNYVLSLWYRTEGGKSGERIGGGLYLPFGGFRVPRSNKWRKFEVRFNSRDRSEVRIYLGAYAVGTVWYDDIELRRADDPTAPNLIPNGDFELAPEITLDEMVRRYRLNHLAHRVSDQNIVAPQIYVDKRTGNVEIDWSAFDRELAFYLRHGLSAFNIFWARLPTGWGKVAEATENQRRIASEILHQTQAHLERKGWAKLAYIYVIDEPSAKYFPQVRSAFQIVKRATPKLKTLLTFGYGATRPWRPGDETREASYAQLLDVVDIFVPHIDCYDPKVIARARMKERSEIWLYVCISAKKPYPNIWAIDYPGTSHRVIFWMLFRYDITGFLYWATTYWKEDPWRNPMTYPGGNSDGSLLYYSRKGMRIASIQPEWMLMRDEPIDSIRWEIIRDGIEDYDMLRMLQERLKMVRNPKLRQRIIRALDVTRVCRTFTDYTEDPTVIGQQRKSIGGLLDALH